jgi:hypothetical protein
VNNLIPLRPDVDPPVRAEADIPVLLTTEELAELLRVDPSTIRRWRTSTPRMGPPFIPMSGRVTKYDLADVKHWLKGLRVDTEAA